MRYLDILNKWIIRTLENNRHRTPLLDICESFLFLIPVTLVVFQLFISPKKEHLTSPEIYTFAMLGLAWAAYRYIPEPYFYAKMLHQILPGKQSRIEEIRHFVGQQVPRSVKPKSNFFNPHLTGLKDDPDYVLKNYFQFSQSFKRFFLERITIDGKVQAAKLFLLLLIPRRKTMPIDTLREIILSLNFHSFNATQIEKLDYLATSDSDQLDKYFEDLTIEQIKSIFTRPFDPEQYIDLLLELKESNLKLRPAKTLTDLIRFSPTTALKNTVSSIRRFRMSNRSPLRHKFLPKIKQFLPAEYDFKVLLSYSDFYTASETFSNCVRSYAEAASDVFIVTINKNPVACVEVKSGQITEISGHGNTPVRSEIRSMIKDAFNKSKAA